MRPPARKNRGRRGIIKVESVEDMPASLTTLSLSPAQSPQAEEPQESLIVKLKLPAGHPLLRPSKIVKLKVPPIPPRPQKVVKLPMRPRNLVGVANASNEMRIEAQVEAIERRQREREETSARPHMRSPRSLPVPLSSQRLQSPALKEMSERTTTPRRVTFDLDVQGVRTVGAGLPPPLSPLTVGPITPGLPGGLGPYPPGFEPGAELPSPRNQPPPMMLPMPPRVLALRAPAATKSAAPRQGDIMTMARAHKTAPTVSAAVTKVGIMTTTARKLATTPRALEALLKPPPSRTLLPPPRASTVKTKSKRGRLGGIRRALQPLPPRPKPTEIPVGPVPLYPYGHKWVIEPKDQFLRRFERLNAAEEAKREQDKQWSKLAEESCKKFREEYPNADEELMAWKSARRPANWDTYSGP